MIAFAKMRLGSPRRIPAPMRQMDAASAMIKAVGRKRSPPLVALSNVQRTTFAQEIRVTIF